MPRNMVRRLLPCSVLAVLAGSALAAQQAPSGEGTHAETEIADAAHAPQRPAEMAANPPRVSCAGDKLTITAENSSLRSVLTAIQACTGIEIEIPETGTDDRTYVQLGPGSVNDVMEALLSPTELNYVIRSSDSASGKIPKVLLIARTEDASEGVGQQIAAGATMTPARRAWAVSRNAAGRAVNGTAGTEEVQSAETMPVTSDSPVSVSSKQAGESAATIINAAGSKDIASDLHPALTTAEANVPQDAAPQPGAVEFSQDAPGAKALQNKISDMEQLFEQRKKMAASSGPVSTPD